MTESKSVIEVEYIKTLEECVEDLTNRLAEAENVNPQRDLIVNFIAWQINAVVEHNRDRKDKAEYTMLIHGRLKKLKSILDGEPIICSEEIKKEVERIFDIVFKK